MASTLALALGAVAIVSGVAMFLVSGIRGSNECETTLNLIVSVLTWTALMSSALAVILGIVALVRGSARWVWALVGVVGGGVMVIATWLGASGCRSGAA